MDFLTLKYPCVPQVNPTWSWWLVCSCTTLWNSNHECFKIFTSTFLSKSEQKVSFFVTSLSSVAIDVLLALLFIRGVAPLLLNVLGPFLGPLPSVLLGVITLARPAASAGLRPWEGSL